MSQLASMAPYSPIPKANAALTAPAEKQIELPVWHETVQAGKLIVSLQKHVQRLRNGPTHGNRQLFLDDVFIAYLLAFFNPSIRSLRTIEDFSQTKQAQKHLSTDKICKSTLSDFNQLVDPSRLEPILTALREELTKRSAEGRLHAPDLNSLLQQIIAVDGTFLHAAADVAWAVCSRNQRAGECYRARLDLHVDVRTWMPEVIAVPDPGESEGDSASHLLKAGAIYLYDRGFISYNVLTSHYKKTDSGDWERHADFVLRLKKSTAENSIAFDVVSTNELTPAASAAAIYSDRVVRSAGLQKLNGLNVEFREVILMGSDGKELRLLSNRLDLPAEIIALLYRYRWQVELFFRWMKSYANFNHLISHSAGGVLLHFYVALIGVMLMYLQTGHRPSKYMMSLLSLVTQGATMDEIMPILEERERRCELDRQSAAKRRAKKNA
ncbi:MAG: Transposase protein [Planctomycetaceae bacterium]|nr:Transposase protein [Planctomycetaceae bacterium]